MCCLHTHFSLLYRVSVYLWFLSCQSCAGGDCEHSTITTAIATVNWKVQDRGSCRDCEGQRKPLEVTVQLASQNYVTLYCPVGSYRNRVKDKAKTHRHRRREETEIRAISRNYIKGSVSN